MHGSWERTYALLSGCKNAHLKMLQEKLGCGSVHVTWMTNCVYVFYENEVALNVWLFLQHCGWNAAARKHRQSGDVGAEGLSEDQGQSCPSWATLASSLLLIQVHFDLSTAQIVCLVRRWPWQLVCNHLLYSFGLNYVDVPCNTLASCFKALFFSSVTTPSLVPWAL